MPVMSAVLPISEIKQQFQDEWVLIAYTQIDENLNVIAGEVLAHSPNVETLYHLLPQYPDRPVAFEYVGEVPEDIAFIL
jgi:hypothetical protein